VNSDNNRPRGSVEQVTLTIDLILGETDLGQPCRHWLAESNGIIKLVFLGKSSCTVPPDLDSLGKLGKPERTRYRLIRTRAVMTETLLTFRSAFVAVVKL